MACPPRMPSRSTQSCSNSSRRGSQEQTRLSNDPIMKSMVACGAFSRSASKKSGSPASILGNRWELRATRGNSWPRERQDIATPETAALFPIRQHTCRSIRYPALCCATTARWVPRTARQARDLPHWPLKLRLRRLTGKSSVPRPTQTTARMNELTARWKGLYSRPGSPSDLRRVWNLIPGAVATPRRSASIDASVSTVMRSLQHRVY